MKHRESGFLRSTLLTALLGSMLLLTTAGCMGPAMNPTIHDAGWSTDYEDALSPHTQLALGVLKALKEEPDSIAPGQRIEIARRWQTLAGLIDAKAPPGDINAARIEVEKVLTANLVNSIKAEKTTRGDLMGFMMSSGVRLPKGGMASLNPDHVAAVKTVEALNNAAAK